MMKLWTLVVLFLLVGLAYADQNTDGILIVAQSGADYTWQVYASNTGEYASSVLVSEQAPTVPEVSGFKVDVNGNTVNLRFTLVGSGTYTVVYTMTRRPAYHYTTVEQVAGGVQVNKSFSLSFEPDRVYIVVIGGKARGWPPFWAELPGNPLYFEPWNTLPWKVAISGSNVLPIDVKSWEPAGAKVSILQGYAFPAVVVPAKVYGVAAGKDVKVILEVVG